MWLEAILSRDDVASLVAKLIPFTVHLGDDDGREHYVELRSLAETTLVPGRGLRIHCAATIRWPVLGISVPIEVQSLFVVVAPFIDNSKQGGSLVFNVEIENADVSGIPALIERPVIDKINDTLARDGVRPAWPFARALSHVFQLPRRIEPVSALDLQVAWGEVRVTDEAWVFAISFRCDALHDGAGAPAPTAGRPVFRRSTALATRSVSMRRAGHVPRELAIAGGFAIASVALVGGLGALLRRRH